MADNRKYVQAQRFRLAGSGISSSATSLILQSFRDPAGTSLTMSDFGTLAYLVLEPGTSREETVSFTGVTQNGDGTATLSGLTRGLGFRAPYTSVSANQKAHGGGSIAILSDPAVWYDGFLNKDNDETINGVYEFTAVPNTTSDPVSGNDLVRRSWVLGNLPAGAVGVDAVIVPGTAGETVAAGQLVYFDTTDDEWKLCDADIAATLDNVLLGIAQGSGTNGNAITNGVLIQGNDKTQTGMTQGNLMYAGNTAGAIVSSSGTTERVVGIARTNTSLYFDPNFFYRISANTKAALVGSSGTPSNTNRFVTQNDSTIIPPGSYFPFVGRTAPSGYLLCDGSAVSRTTYASLFAALCPSQTFTVTIASPGVFTSTAHGFVAGDIVRLTTTGALPTGLATGTDYYVLSAGLTADNFRLALSPTASAINTSGSQSGTHTVWLANWGFGDGSTTFNVPDLRGLTTVGRATSAQTFRIVFESGAVNTTNDTIDVLDRVFPSQGQAVVLTTTGGAPGGLTASSTYYVIRSGTATTIKLASSLANANAGTAIDLTTGGSGVHTLTFTARTHPNIGYKGGEDSHAIATTELASHTHVNNANLNASSSVTDNVNSLGGASDTTRNTNATGGNEAHNNMQPFVVSNYIIKT